MIDPSPTKSRTISLSANGRNPAVASSGRSWWFDDALAYEGGTSATLDTDPLYESIDADVAIVGGGYTGLWTALRIRELSPATRVVVLEGDLCGSGASGKNGGFVHGYLYDAPRLIKLFGVDRAREIIDAGSAAQRAIEEFAATRAKEVWWRNGGIMKVSTVERQDRKLDELVDAAHTLGLQRRVRSLSEPEVQSRCRSPLFRRGVFVGEGATVHPARLVRALRRAAITAGVDVFEHSPVVTVRAKDRNVLTTPEGTVTAGEVVLASNAALAGLRPIDRLITNFSSYAVMTEPIPDRLEQLNWTGGEGITDGRMFLHYFRTTPDGRLLMGTGSGPIGFRGRLDGRLSGDPAAINRARAAVTRMFPQLKNVVIEEAWGGPIEVSGDHLPFVGTLPSTSVHYACGYSGHGVNPSYIAAQYLAAKVIGAPLESADCSFVARPLQRFPVDPFRYVGARFVRASILACEEAEDAGRPSPLIARGGAALPRLFGMKVGTR